MADQQNYKNHTRWYPLFHFVVMPLLVINFLSHLIRLFMAAPESGRKTLAFWTLLSLVLILLGISARLQALKAQDRVIRLEERLRYKELLSPELAQRASNLPEAQIIALRFASDGELAELVEQVLDGKLKSQKEIKLAVKNWRADHFRV